MNRREFLGAAVLLHPCAIAGVLASVASHQGSPADLASDKTYWFKVQQAFAVDRSIVNLNSCSVSPSPAVAHDALKRHLDQDGEPNFG